MDRVGLFEPTTSGSFVKPHPPIYQKDSSYKGKKEVSTVQIPPLHFLMNFSSAPLQHH
jgi:hypothetical protein